MSKQTIKVLEVAYHRNGISGIGFDVVRFTDSASAPGEFVAILFPESGACAVLNVPQLAQGNIAFAGGNSWRGDHFEGDLREAIVKHTAKRLGMPLREYRKMVAEDAKERV